MLSPKMQRAVRVNEHQLLMLSDRAQYDHSMVSSQPPQPPPFIWCVLVSTEVGFVSLFSGLFK